MTRLEAKKSLGQHFLKNATIAREIAAAAELRPGDTVVEVGPGTGALTEPLLATKAKVIAIEADGRAMDILRERFPEATKGGYLKLIHGDIREISLADLPITEGEYAVAANIPYYISGQLFRFFLGEKLPKTLVFLVQKEVAERAARSEKESLLSLSLKAYGTPLYVRTVSRGNFVPVPGVDSAILKLAGISRQRFAGIPEDFFFNVLHAGFAARRKQLFGNLKKIFSEDVLRTTFEATGLPLTVRGEDVSIDDWFRLARELHGLST